jgi:outer membrane protein assembly factor BamD
MRRIGRLAAVGVLAVAVLWACGSSEGGDKSVAYSVTAKSNYEKGLKELKDENFPEAMKYFNFVKQKFPFSKYAVLAELRIADTQFERGRYLEAIDQYKVFGRSHPTHELVEDGYVGFRICEAYTKQMPEDFILIPPSFEKDQSATKDALRELDMFIEKWPKSKYIDRAKQLRQRAASSLAASELYVAKFYLKRSKFRAAAWRAEVLLKEYAGTPLDAEALLVLGQAYERLKEPDKARDALSRLVKEHPKTKEAGQAAEILRRLPPPPTSG